MWTIKRRHQHITADTLSEYLDGRIDGPALARLERQLAACGVCRDELESLQATVMLLRDLPVEVPGRSFIMAAPPPEPAPFRPSPPARVPQWVYAGAASMAAILLAVLVTADTTGLLAPDEPTRAGELAAAPAAIRETAVAEAGSQDSPQAAQSLESDAPVATEELSPSTEDEVSQPPQVAMAVAEDAIEPAEAPTAVSLEAGELAAAPAAIRETPVAEAGSQVSPQAAQALESAAPVAMEDLSPSTEDKVSQPPQVAMAVAEDVNAPEEVPTAASLEAGAAASPIELSEPESASEPVAPESQIGIPSQEADAPPPEAVPESISAPVAAGKGTALFWRFLEGIAAALGLAFLVAFALKRRIFRSAGRVYRPGYH